MQINRAVDYSVRSLLYMAGRPKHARVTLAEIAAARKVPLPYLTLLMKKLAMSGFVSVHRGRSGGYTLAKPPEKINLRGIMEAIDGELSLNLCLEDPAACQFSSTCAVRPVWKELQEKWLADLARYSLARLLSVEK